MGRVGGRIPRSERPGSKSIWREHGGTTNLSFHCPRDSCCDFFPLGIDDAASSRLGSDRVRDNQYSASFEWQDRSGSGPFIVAECIISVASKRESHTEPRWVDCNSREN